MHRPHSLGATVLSHKGYRVEHASAPNSELAFARSDASTKGLSSFPGAALTYQYILVRTPIKLGCSISCCCSLLSWPGALGHKVRVKPGSSGHHTPQEMRAFLLAKATTAFCQPTRSLSCTSHGLIGSLRLWAVITADLVPLWINRVRK